MKKIFILIVGLVFNLNGTAAYSANDAVNNAANSLDSKSSTQLLIIGDSISAGYGLRPDESWVNLLQQRIKTSGFNHTVVNASLTGDTTAGGLNRIQSILDRHPARIIIIELGGNDGLRGLSLKKMRKNLKQMIEISQSNQRIVLLVGMALPPNYGPAYTQKFSAIYRRIAEQKNVALVPFMMQGFAEKSEYFQADKIHPNAIAQPLLLDNVWPTLLPLLQL